MMSSKSLENFRKYLKDDEFINSVQALMDNKVSTDSLEQFSNDERRRLIEAKLLDEQDDRVMPGTFHAEYMLSELLPVIKRELRESVRRVIQLDTDLSKDLELVNTLHDRIEGIESVIRKKVGALRLAIDKEVSGTTNRIIGELTGFSKEFQVDEEGSFNIPELDPRVITTALTRTRQVLSVSLKQLDEMLTNFLNESFGMFISDWEKYSQEINKSLEEDFSSIDKLLKESRSEVYQQVQKIGRASVADDAIFQYDLENILNKLEELLTTLKTSQVDVFTGIGTQIIKEVEKANQLFFLSLRTNLESIERKVSSVIERELKALKQLGKEYGQTSVNIIDEFMKEIFTRVNKLLPSTQDLQNKIESALDNLHATMIKGIQEPSNKVNSSIQELMILEEESRNAETTMTENYQSVQNAVNWHFTHLNEALNQAWENERARLNEKITGILRKQKELQSAISRTLHASKQKLDVITKLDEQETKASSGFEDSLKQQRINLMEQEELLKAMDELLGKAGSNVNDDLRVLRKRVLEKVKNQKVLLEQELTFFEKQRENRLQKQKAFHDFTGAQEQLHESVADSLQHLEHEIGEVALNDAVMNEVIKHMQKSEQEILSSLTDVLGDEGKLKAFLTKEQQLVKSILEMNHDVFEGLETYKAVNTSFIKHNIKALFDGFFDRFSKELQELMNEMARIREEKLILLHSREEALEKQHKEMQFTVTKELSEIMVEVRNKVIESMDKTTKKIKDQTNSVQESVVSTYTSNLEPIEESIHEIKASMQEIFTHFSKTRQEFLEETLATLDAALLKSANLNKNRGKESIQRLSEKYANKIQAMNSTKTEFVESTHKSLAQVTDALLSQLNQLEQEIGEQTVRLAESLEEFQKMKPTLVLNLLHEVHSKIDDATHNLLVRLLKWVNTFENDTINDLGVTQLSNYIYKIRKDVFEEYSIPDKNVEIAVRETLAVMNEVLLELGLLNAKLRGEMD